MVEACEAIEGTIREVHSSILAVAGTKKVKHEQIKLFAEVDIALAAHLINVPKTEEGKTLREQEAALQTTCANTLVLKLSQAAEQHRLSLSQLVVNYSKTIQFSSRSL